jgi:hypothetical protein
MTVLGRKLIEEGSGLIEVGCVKPFGEPVQALLQAPKGSFLFPLLLP